MVALTSERNTRLRIGDLRVEPVAAAIKIRGGALVMRNAAGYLTKGATATGCVGVGRAEKTVDTTAGAANRQTQGRGPCPQPEPASDRPRKSG